MQKIIIGLSALALTAITPVQADPYAILGVSINSSELTDPAGGASTSVNHDEGSSTASFDFGYFFTDNLAGEIGYRSFESSESYNYSGNELAGETDTSIWKIGLKAVTSRDQQFYGFGGAGVAMVDQETVIKTQETGNGLTVGQKVKTDSSNAYYTVGAGYRFSDSTAIEVSYSDFGKDGDNTTPTKPTVKDFSEFTIALNFAF